jgi:nucleotidyltransferase substrate binding protein (TIGR01987 family)
MGGTTMLDISPLEKAIEQLEEALMLCASDLVKSNARLELHMRAAAIQAFEFTYSLSLKMLKRYLEKNEEDSAIVEEMTFNDLVRRGFEFGLLQAEISDWRDFRKNRCTTSHTYDEKKAEDVFEQIPQFLAEAKFLYNAIQKRQESST